MVDFVQVTTTEDGSDVTFYIEHDEVMAIGDRMNEINEEAYMNGYNWEAFLNYYLEKNEPGLLEGMDTDPEAGMYAAYYEASPGHEEKAKRFGEVIVNLIENEEEIYRIVREHGDEIEWD